jgi:cytoskeletal protein CcmA (bactofilin family)
MNKIITLFIAMLFSSIAFSQAPEKMSYQSVIRDNHGILLSNKKVTIQISILRGSKEGESVFVETHDATTNENGLVSLQIGGGKVEKGSFADIHWAQGSFFIKTATDPNGGSDFNIIGVSELLSVPYALFAKTAANVFSGDYNDLANKPMKLSQFINDTGFMSKSNAAAAAPSPGVPSQNWSLFGNSSSNPAVDKLGTTDLKDLVIVTNNIERLRIFADGNISLKKSLEIGEDLNVKRNVNLNITGGQTTNNGNFTVAKGSSTFLTGTADIDKTLNVDGITTLQSALNVLNGSATHLTGTIDVDQSANIDGATDLNSTLTVDGATNLNSTLNVNNSAATHLTGTLEVDGVTNLDNNLNVNNEAPTHLTGTLDVDKSLNVDGAFDLNGTLSVGGVTNLNNDLNVNENAPVHFTGTLDVDQTLNVDGVTSLQSALNVNNGAATHLTGLLDVDGTLNVDGITSLQSALNVNNASPAHLTGTLDVDGTLNADGITSLQSALNVNNNSPTNLTGILAVGQAATFSNVLNANGQVTISTSVAGEDSSYGAYPLRVQGSAQGIAIKLTAGTPDNDNNFVTFFNSAGDAVGRIEGETTSEVDEDPEFIFDESILVAEEAKAIVNVVSAAIPVPVALVVGECVGCIAMAAADLVLATANLIAYNVFAHENLGVTYQSGSADYAEWLERYDSREKIIAGDIVSVNGGKISKNSQNAQQYMVVSTKPAILGNMPEAGHESLYEKVAFMGQIPVKVRGIILSGDYILPSGQNDGIGIGVSRTDIKPEQYRQIVGVAWSNSLVNGSVTMVNMAIGLNANDVADLAVQQEKKIKALEAKFGTLEQRIVALEGGKSTIADVASATVPPVSQLKEKSRYEILASNMPAELSDKVMEDAIQNLQNTYAQQGMDVKKHPGLNKLFTDAAFKAQVIKKAQETYRKSYQEILATSRN